MLTIVCDELDATFKNVWDTISAYQQSADGGTAKKNTRIESIETIESVAADSMVGISSGQLASALDRVGVAEDSVTQVAPVSSIQGTSIELCTLEYMLTQSHDWTIVKRRLANTVSYRVLFTSSTEWRHRMYKLHIRS